jgi:hypothetical protein
MGIYLEKLLMKMEEEHLLRVEEKYPSEMFSWIEDLMEAKNDDRY